MVKLAKDLAWSAANGCVVALAAAGALVGAMLWRIAGAVPDGPACLVEGRWAAAFDAYAGLWWNFFALSFGIAALIRFRTFHIIVSGLRSRRA